MRIALVFVALLSGCTCFGIIGDTDGGGGAGGAGGAGGGSAGAGGSGGGGGSTVQCPVNQHACGAACVSDDSPDTCADRCTACPGGANATATCVNRACGLECASGFALCLGQCVPDSAGPCGVSLPANEFVKLLDGGTGSRTQAAMLYSADAGQYLLIGGARTASPQPYDVLAFDLASRAWKNVYPPNKSWGPDVGNTTAPGFASEAFETADTSGVTRPNFNAYGGTTSAYQYAWDEGHQRLYFYLWNRTFSYDARARAWTFHSPPSDPAGGPMKPRLVWGALGYDAVGDKLLLVGGGNVLTDAGEAGSSIYDVAQNTWRALTGPQPLRRAYSKLVVDPDRRKALLFGGDELDRLKSDTWVFDFATETWAEVTPPSVPAPRAGHQLLFLPQSRETVLLGGWGYTSTTDYVASPYAMRGFELWRFDWGSSTWALVKRFNGGPGIDAFRNLAWPAAAGAGDVVLLQFKNGYPDEDRAETWALRIDPTARADAGELAVDAGSVTWRTNRYDPAWFALGADTDAGTNAVAKNAWQRVNVPNRPATNHDWGTMAIDVTRRQLLRWSGGHSAYCGTDVLHYDLATNRFSIGFAPELPLEFTYTNDQVPGQWSFKRRPWMNVHTYKTYAYDAVLSSMLVYKVPYTYFYDDVAKDFVDPPVHSDLGGDAYVNTLEPIPTGMAAWTPNGVFVREGTARVWSALTLVPMNGAALPQQSPDQQSMVYDPVGNRLLLFPNVAGEKGQVYEVSLGAQKTLRKLDPVGRADLAAGGPGFFRESELVNGFVVVAATYALGGVNRSPVYDVASNRWEAWRLDPQNIPYGNSFAIAYDPVSGLLWALAQNNEPYVLSLDPATADRVQLN